MIKTVSAKLKSKTVVVGHKLLQVKYLQCVVNTESYLPELLHIYVHILCWYLKDFGNIFCGSLKRFKGESTTPFQYARVLKTVDTL